VEEDPTDPVEMDEVLCDYIHYLHQYGQPKSHASLAFCGLIYFMPKYRSHLHLSFRALRGWNKLRPPTVRPPATRGVALGTAAELWHRGHREASVMVLLAFEGFLRNAEVVALRFNDIALPGDMRLGVAPEGTAGVRIRRAKTGGGTVGDNSRPFGGRGVAAFHVHIGYRGEPAVSVYDVGQVSHRVLSRTKVVRVRERNLHSALAPPRTCLRSLPRWGFP